MTLVEPAPLRVAFAGTPAFASVALEALLAAGFVVPLVLTQPDRPAGRGLKLQPSAVKTCAQATNLPLLQPRSLRLDGALAADAQAAQAALLAARPDVMLVAAYGLILPAWVLALPRLGCLNIHASLLPRWRGAAPIHRAIEAGDTHSGITLMQMDAGLDTGDILLTQPVDITAHDTTGTLHDRLAPLGAALAVEVLRRLQHSRLPAQPQPAEGVVHAPKISKAEAVIDWAQPAALIERRIRAFNPAPGASTHLRGEPIKVWRAALEPGTVSSGQPPGTVIGESDAALRVACGEGTLALTELQRAGGKRLPARSFCQGLGALAGCVLTAVA